MSNNLFRMAVIDVKAIELEKARQEQEERDRVVRAYMSTVPEKYKDIIRYISAVNEYEFDVVISIPGHADIGVKLESISMRSEQYVPNYYRKVDRRWLCIPEYVSSLPHVIVSSSENWY